MMYWTLFLVSLFPDGKVDYESGYEVIMAYESRLECEVVRSRVIALLGPLPEKQELICLRTDET